MSWDDRAENWDNDPVVRAYSEAAFTSLEECLAARHTSLQSLRVLDFGCGTGLLTQRMAQHAREVVGLDLSAHMVAVLQRKGLANVRAEAGTLEALAADGRLGAFDVITCSSVCAFLDDYPGTAIRLANLLTPGGLLVQWDWELNPEQEEPLGLSRDQIARALGGAGLVGVTVDVGFTLQFEGHTMAPLRGIGQRA